MATAKTPTPGKERLKCSQSPPRQSGGQSRPPLTPHRCSSCHDSTLPFPLRMSRQPHLQPHPHQFHMVLNTNSSTCYHLPNTCLFTDGPCGSSEAQPRSGQLLAANSLAASLRFTDYPQLEFEISLHQRI